MMMWRGRDVIIVIVAMRASWGWTDIGAHAAGTEPDLLWGLRVSALWQPVESPDDAIWGPNIIILLGKSSLHSEKL